MAIEVGSKLEGKVTGITHFGAFVELPEGGTGLVHISEIADNYVKDVNDHLKLSDMVTVKVINVDKDGKIGLSIKQAVDKPPEAARPQRYERPAGSSGGGGMGGSGGSSGGGDRGGRGGGGGGGFGGGGRGGDRGNRGGKAPVGKLTFEDKVSRFLKDSEERISSLKKNTEGKRGGRGARRD
ncbi:S1 domain-containing RNA-binding protein [Paenibacillus agricola]|uniref:RNA-binding protein S1 n=1 Tax=Paenibacillus agricola TaxID=2716264 RepID=A0ABX0JJ65_9BACL|nr:S1 domain-containing RNA-binding protein [Paenibacillus agricola]NHN35067.1 RNA-binding protein S1 [Paenibacillus agricola]